PIGAAPPASGAAAPIPIRASPAIRRCRCSSAAGTSKWTTKRLHNRQRQAAQGGRPAGNRGAAYCVGEAVASLWVRVRRTPHNSEVARGSTASAGAREAALLPLLRADVRAAARARDGRDSQPRGPEVRVPQLLLPAHDPRRSLRRAAVG